MLFVKKAKEPKLVDAIIDGKLQQVMVLVKNKDQPVIIKADSCVYAFKYDGTCEKVESWSQFGNIEFGENFSKGVAEIVLSDGEKQTTALLSYANLEMYDAGESNSLNLKQQKEISSNSIAALKSIAQNAYDDPLKFKEIAPILSIIDKRAAYFALDAAYSRFVDEANIISREYEGKEGASDMLAKANRYQTAVIKEINNTFENFNNGLVYADIMNMLWTNGAESFDPSPVVAACATNLLANGNPSVAEYEKKVHEVGTYISQIKQGTRKQNNREINSVISLTNEIIADIKIVKSILAADSNFGYIRHQVERLSEGYENFGNFLLSKIDTVIAEREETTLLADKILKQATKHIVNLQELLNSNLSKSQTA